MPNKTAAEIAQEAQIAKDNPVNRDDKAEVSKEVEQVRTDATESYNRNKKRLVDAEANNRANEELSNEEFGVSLEEQGQEENIEVEAEELVVGGPGHEENELIVEQKKEEIKNDPIFKAKSKAEKIAENYKKIVDDATKGIDSNRVLANIGNNGFAAIGMALAVMGSALGSALTGNKGNAAMDAINRIIDQDISEQKYNRELKLKKAGALRKDLDKALADEKKQKTLDGLKRYKYLAAVRSQVEMKMYATNDPKKKAEYKKALGLIEKQLTKVYGDFSTDVTKFVISEENKLSVAKSKSRVAEAKKVEEINKRTINFNGRDVVLRVSASEKTINELQNKTNSNTKGNRIINELLTIDDQIKSGKYGSLGSAKFDRDLNARVKPLLAFLKSANRVELIGPGAISKGEWDILNEIAANPLDTQLWGSDKAKSALQSLKKTLNSNLQTEIEGWAEKGTFQKFDSKEQKKGLKNTKSVGETRIITDGDSLSVVKKGDRRSTINGEEIYNGVKWVPYNGK